MYSLFRARELKGSSHLKETYKLWADYCLFKETLKVSDEDFVYRLRFISTYEIYCKTINLDNEIIKTFKLKLTDIDIFTAVLADSGAAQSLQLIYSEEHISGILKQMHELKQLAYQQMYPAEKHIIFTYENISRTHITDLKCRAIFSGRPNIVKDFYPLVLKPTVLATIFYFIEIAYGLEECLINPMVSRSAYSGKNERVLTVLLNQLGDYKECIDYLLHNGVSVDESNDREGYLSYLSESDSNITIRHFCELYREFVSDEVKPLFDLVLATEKTNTYVRF